MSPCRELLDLNPDNYQYHTNLRRALGVEHSPSGKLSDKQQSELEALYTELVEKYAKSTTPSRMRLDFLVSFTGCRLREGRLC